MRPLVPIVAILFAVCLATCLPSIASSQDDHGPEPGMVVTTRMQLTTVGDLDGSGDLTITLKGESARDFREYVLSEFDSDMDQLIQPGEAKDLLVALSSALNGQLYWGVTINPTSDFANMTETKAAEMTTGLIRERWDSTDDVSFSMAFDCKGLGFSKVIFITQSAVDTFCGAILQATGYTYEGVMRLDHQSTALGVGSFTSPDMPNGTLREVRTPAGVLIWYSTDVGVDGMAEVSLETVLYEEISVIENTQIAFVILFIGSLMMIRVPAKRFEKFKKLHPKRYRKYASPRRSPKVLTIVLLAVLWLLYVVPFLLSYAVDGLVVHSYYFMFLVPLAAVGQYAFTRHVYDKSTLDIPEDMVVEFKQAQLESDSEVLALCAVCFKPIELDEDMHVCESCNIEMHMECADRAGQCPACEAILFPQDTRSIECKACGESFLHSGMDDQYSIQCTRCGAFQEEVEAGKNYLVVDKDPTMAYRMIRAMGLSGRAAIAMTVEFPGKIRADYDLGEDVDVRWFSESTTDIDNVNPHDLEGDAMETCSTFLATTKRAGLMLDGLDMLMDLNGFDRVMAFVRRLNDLASIHGSTIIVHVDRSRFDEDAYNALSDEFDETHDYS